MKFDEAIEEILNESITLYKTKITELQDKHFKVEVTIPKNKAGIVKVAQMVWLHEGFTGSWKFEFEEDPNENAGFTGSKILSLLGIQKLIKVNPKDIPFNVIANVYASILHTFIVDKVYWIGADEYQFRFDNDNSKLTSMIKKKMEEFLKKYLDNKKWGYSVRGQVAEIYRK